MQKLDHVMQNMTRGEHLAHSVSFALSKAQKVVRGLWLGLTDKGVGMWLAKCRTPEGAWRLVGAERGDRKPGI
jgi:hypothetical protein